MPLSHKRAALRVLSIKRIRGLCDLLGLSRARIIRKDDLIDAIVRSDYPYELLLGQLRRDELKNICAVLGINASGRAKGTILARIVASEPNSPVTLPMPATHARPPNGQHPELTKAGVATTQNTARNGRRSAGDDGVNFASHPLARGNPPRWADTWGQDRSGVFVGFVVDGIEYRMRWIESGRFLMGSPADEGRWSNEGPQHEVTLTRGFWLGETPVTQALWEAVMGSNPSKFKGPEQPVETVSWDDCQALCARLEALAPGIGLRLPSEAEWEYACRAGTTGPTYAGAGEQALDPIAWWSGNSENQTHPVRKKQPNAWGLHDMLGNVWEWCCDWNGGYSSESAVDPRGPVEGDHRVARGGGWDDGAGVVRAAYRYASPPGLRDDDLGLRLARGQE